VLRDGLVFVGAVIIIVLQYGWRRTEVARALALLGAVSLPLLQLPWDTAFALQAALTEPPAPQNPVRLVWERTGPIWHDDHVRVVGSGGGAGSGSGAREATRELLQGRVGAAVRFLRGSSSAAERRVPVDLPLRVTGLAPDQLLLIDRAQLRLLASDGAHLYGAVIRGPPGPLRAAFAGGEHDARQGFESGVEVESNAELPQVQQSTAGAPPRLVAEYFMTLLQLRTEYQMPLSRTPVRTRALGLCATQTDADLVAVRCLSMGQPPTCFAATLYGSDGRHNPEVLKCVPDYRPYLPAITDAVSSSGIDLPIRDRSGFAHYPVEAGDLDRSYVVFRIYGVRSHWTQTLEASLDSGVRRPQQRASGT
jgi:hypothetical protein